MLADDERLDVAGPYAQPLGQVDAEAQAVDQGAGGTNPIMSCEPAGEAGQRVWRVGDHHQDRLRRNRHDLGNDSRVDLRIGVQQPQPSLWGRSGRWLRRTARSPAVMITSAASVRASYSPATTSTVGDSGGRVAKIGGDSLRARPCLGHERGLAAHPPRSSDDRAVAAPTLHADHADVHRSVLGSISATTSTAQCGAAANACLPATSRPHRSRVVTSGRRSAVREVLSCEHRGTSCGMSVQRWALQRSER
jgi:hypothetical protein